LRFERVDNLEACRIPAVTGLLIPFDSVNYEWLGATYARRRSVKKSSGFAEPSVSDRIAFAEGSG
jgi:hypothetical protein